MLEVAWFAFMGAVSTVALSLALDVMGDRHPRGHAAFASLALGTGLATVFSRATSIKGQLIPASVSEWMQVVWTALALGVGCVASYVILKLTAPKPPQS